MKKLLIMADDDSRLTARNAAVFSPPVTRAAFTLIEVMVAVALLSLIVISLMGVFNSTQAAFRASVTQTDVLESGRAVMEMVAADLRVMAPSMGYYTNVNNLYGPVNFYVAPSLNPPLVQPLTASDDSRTNFQQDVFILSRDNVNGAPTWTGTGYTVFLSPSNIYSLYRFSMSTNVAAASPVVLYNIFVNSVNNGVFTNMSHLMDGVVGFRVRAYDPYGNWLTNGYIGRPSASVPVVKNALFDSPYLGEVGFRMYSNTLPAAVEIEIATLEDRTLQRAASRPGDLPLAPPNDARSSYLQNQAGNLHLFRQRVNIPNVDPSVYQ